MISSCEAYRVKSIPLAGSSLSGLIECWRRDMTDRFLTVVIRNPTPEEAQELIYHPKLSAASWSHTMDERDDDRR
jgi:hypothetical protein